MSKNTIKVIDRINGIIKNGGTVEDVTFVNEKEVQFTGATIDSEVPVDREYIAVQIPSKYANNEERAIIEMMKNRNRHDYIFASDYMQAVGQGYDGSIDIMEDIFGISEFDIIEMFHDVD